MGFPAGGFIAIELPKPALLLVNFLVRIWFVIVSILRFIGFLGSLRVRASSRSTAPPSPSSLKSRLRVVEYVSLMKRGEPTCMICLEELEEKVGVRELSNCSHAFHMVCMDRWIDMRQTSCPLCRSQLLPLKKGKKGRGLFKLLPKSWWNGDNSST